MVDLSAVLGPGPITDAANKPTQAFRAVVNRLLARTGGLSGASTTDASGAAAVAQAAAEAAQAAAVQAQAAAMTAQMLAQMAALAQAQLAIGQTSGDFSADFSPKDFATSGAGLPLTLQDMLVLTLTTGSPRAAAPDQSGSILALLGLAT